MVETSLQASVAANLAAAPIFGVVRTDSYEEAADVARLYLAGGLRVVEITFTVPRATELVRQLKESAGTSGVSIGMGTVTTEERARRALEVEADFIVSPNVSSDVAAAARSAGCHLVLGALTCTEIVAAYGLGADLVKVYPLAPVGGPAYLEVIRQPLGDLPMLAAGGFGVDEIPAYRAAGATAFGIGAPLLGASENESLERIRRALRLATGEADR